MLFKAFIYLSHVPASSQLHCSAYGSSDGCFCHHALYIHAHYRPPAEILLNETGQKRLVCLCNIVQKNAETLKIPHGNIFYLTEHNFVVYGHFLMSIQYNSPAGKQQPASSLPVVC